MAAMSPQPLLGLKLRELRSARRVSVRVVAEATGISPSFISLVETGNSDITMGRLIRLIDYFGVSLTDLLPSGSTADELVVRKDEQRVLHSESEHIDISLPIPDTRRMMMPMLLTYAPNARPASFGQHPGEEWVHVLAGELSLEFDGEPPRILSAGDSAYYATTRPHLFANARTDIELKLVCVVTPPNL